jgi:Cys-rich repeat protein
VQTQCIAPLAVTNPTITLESGKPFTLTWTPSSVPSSRITVFLDLSHHGGSKGRVLCDAPDTGSLQIPGALLESLMSLGVTGYPRALFTRVLTGSTPVGSGQAELKLYSDRDYVAEIPGLVSCETDADCTSPEICQVPGQMCGVPCTSNADCPTGRTCLPTKICSK